MQFRTPAAIVAAGLAAVASLGALFAAQDFGEHVENEVRAHAPQNFGVSQPLQSEASGAPTSAEIEANPLVLAELAGGLSAKVVTTAAGTNTDMIVLWPNDTNPTHLLTCNEQGTGSPGYQRIEIATGAVETIVTGTQNCDGTRATPWGTVLFSEEVGPSGPNTGGRVYELIDPLNTTGVSLNRTTGVFSGGTNPQNLVAREAIGRLSFEGFALYETGVMYYGDELRPGSGTPGGAYFRFIPTTPWTPDAPAITTLAQSPFASGSVYGLKLAGSNSGQGTQTGTGAWVFITNVANTDLRAAALTFKLSGYYRPEDIDIDRAAEAAGNVRWCGANTGNESVKNYGEFICVTDGTVAQSLANAGTPSLQFLVVGNPEVSSPDNTAYQPGRGNWAIIEDRDHSDIWMCLDDGSDDDLLGDGCIRVISLTDPEAEWTGGIFDSTGTRFFVSAQHNTSGKGIIFEITGWK